MMMRSKWFWISLVVLLIGGGFESEGCLEQERVALLQLKSFFHDFHDWVDVKGSNCCEWERVKCSVTGKRVIELSLNYTRIWAIDQYGYLNASLFLPFTELNTLYLIGNNMAGFVENEGFVKLGSVFKKLEILDLSGNHLNDRTITSLSEISSLKSLYLAGNEITVGSNGFAKLSSGLKKLEILELSGNYDLDGSMLSSLSELSSLKSLYLSGINFSRGSNHTNGFEWLSRFRNLETLHLSGSNLDNNILLHVAALSSLKTLNLAGNQLEGSFNIKELNRMMNLEELDLSGNLLHNSSFAFISGLSNLKALYIGRNNLQGSIDIKELNKLAKLKILDMSVNQIESIRSFDDSEKQLKLMDLEQLDLRGNLLNNSILGVVGGLSNLKFLNVRWNQLKGSINIEELEALHDLEELDISYNDLHDVVDPKDDDGSNLSHNNILERIGALASLKRLYLSNSSLTGPLPTKGWCDLWNLEELYLDGNALEGSSPWFFHNLTSLRRLDISNNRIEFAPSFTSFENNTQLQFLFIDQNRLVREPTFQFQTKNPNFQLKLLSMSNCSSTRGLPAQLPNFLRYQYDLRYLDLSYNNFDGQYPFWLTVNNTRLQQFLMVGNSFKGTLQLPKHPNVEMFQVDLSENEMQGQIPMNICSTFPHLEHLFLSQNAFKGNIPPCLGGLKSLSSLDLSFNNFSGGTILEEFGKNNSLQTLRLSNNNLSGKIPPTIFSLSQLYLDGNNFDGEIPLLNASTVSSSYIGHIDLSNNHLSGKLPPWIWNLSTLETLAFSNNHFHDRIPLELCNLGGLRYLDLSQNNLFGSVPACFSSITSLEHLYLSRNKLTGPLPRALYNCSSLVSLDLSHNNFSGNIPNWISTLSALSILILKANHFEGEIPSQICRLNSLSIIDLSQNKLFGHIPSCLSNLTLEPTNAKSYRIQNQRYYSFMIIRGLENYPTKKFYPRSYVEEQVVFTTKKGSYTYSGNILDYMSGIDLSCNMLSGQIPPELGNLSELHSLNLSHNELVGFIPSTFSELKQVESLDISHNKLSGRIPNQLMELNSLAVFNVSYNNFSGSIPHEKAQFATFDDSNYLGNPFLCGPPKHESCNEIGSDPTTPDASGNEEESSLLDKQTFYVTFVVSYTIVLVTIGLVLYINPDWRRAWLYFIQQFIDTCYYFILDNVLGLSLFRKIL